MLEIILNIIFWTLALYGLFEILKTIIYMITYTNLKANGIYLIVAVKNQENNIEGFLRSSLFRMIYGKEEYVKNVMIADLNSVDETKEIAERLSKEYECLKVVNWRECKEIIDNVDECKAKIEKSTK